MCGVCGGGGWCVVSGPDPPCSTGCMFLITSTHRSAWYTPRSELVLDCTIFVHC